jgi:hypothetical protein
MDFIAKLSLIYHQQRKCHYRDCRSFNCYAECRCTECRYTECRGTMGFHTYFFIFFSLKAPYIFKGLVT